MVVKPAIQNGEGTFFLSTIKGLIKPLYLKIIFIGDKPRFIEALLATTFLIP